ncbi:MAG TPA: sigma-70 family RNA polymerase sigma factor [Opitutaceae bacterium]|nr:sigma-70 family RNA polymerase sigma factor [Opitutaceae bacterium]
MTGPSAASLASTVPLSPSRTDASPLRALTMALARGDDASWARFHRDYGPAIFRRLLALTRGDHDLASEALQQTYLRIARYARPCDSEAEFATWLRVVARTALSDCRRRRQSFWQLLRRRAVEPDSANLDAEDDRLLAALDGALALLDADDRALLEAKYLAGADVRSIASRLGISAKAAESRLTRARAELRHRLLAALPRHE